MGWLLNNIQVLIFLLIIGSSVFGWIFKQLKEQTELKRIENEKNRRELESLRTGREPAAAEDRVRAQAIARAHAQAQMEAQVKAAPPARSGPTAPASPSAPGRARLEEIAAKRQAQLAELRRRRAEQLARSQQSGGQSAPTQKGRPPASPQSRPQPQVQPQSQRPAQRSAHAKPTPRRAPSKARATIDRRPLRERQKHETVEQHHLDVSIDQRHLDSNIRSVKSAENKIKSPAADLRATLSNGGIRQAILLSEILAPPVSMRENHLEDS